MDSKNIKGVSVFWSPFPGSGASFTAINTARLLSLRGINCVLLDLDLISPSLSIYFESDDIIHGLDNIIPYINSPDLLTNAFQNNLQNGSGLLWLRGSLSLNQPGLYKPDELSVLIETAKSLFDVVLVDISGAVNAPVKAVLDAADRVFAVVDNDIIKLRKFLGAKPFMAYLDNLALVLNFGFKDYAFDKNEIARLSGIKNVFALPDLGIEFTKSLSKGKWLNFLQGGNVRAKLYNKSLEELIEHMGRA